MIYIDIHTHFEPCPKFARCIINIIAGKEIPPKNKWFSIGIHPWHAQENALSIVQKFASQSYCLAIGECGLDQRPAILIDNDLLKQEAVFLAQARLAEQYQKPLIIHCVKCFDKMLQFKKNISPTVPWIIHGFAKNIVLAEQLVAAGFYLSFGTAVFQNVSYKKTFKNVPVNRIFFETDDQKTYDIKAIYRQAAALLNMDVQDLQNQISQNFQAVFKNANL